jgi:predicted  nucleic acid-binding Zn ribbon protein
MYNVLFKFSFKDEDLLDQDHMEFLLSSFKHNGQVIEYFDHPVIKGNMAVYNGIIIQADSLDVKYYNENTWRFIGLLKENETTFEYEIVAEQPALVINTIADTSAMVLYHGGESPLRSLDDFSNVPLYLIPPTSVDGTNYFNIITWERNYEAIYWLWFRGEVDESYFFNQLINYQSDLSKQGMALCRQIADLTGKKCYYYLFRYPDPDAEDVENCPKCKSPWKLKNELFETFKYKCNNCFLIS